MATQNPVEFHGTYPLPEAQMDRFALQFQLGYVSPEEETTILSDQQTTEIHPIERLQACVSMDDVLALKHALSQIRMSDELKRYYVSNGTSYTLTSYGNGRKPGGIGSDIISMVTISLLFRRVW